MIWTELPPGHRRGRDLAEPYLTYTADLDDFRPRELESGWSGGNSVIGAGWAAWWTQNSRVAVRATGDGASEPVTVTHVPARLDTDGDLLVFATQRRSSREVTAV